LPPGQISLAGLNTAIATATALRDSTVAATDGFAVQAGLWWATLITRGTFVNAITAAETAQTNSTTQADINLATQILNAAITTFNSARSLSEPGDVRIRSGHELILRGLVYVQATNDVLSGEERAVIWRNSNWESPSTGTIDAEGSLLFRIAAPPANVLLPFPEFVISMWGAEMPLTASPSDALATAIGDIDDDALNLGLRVVWGSQNNDLLRENMQENSGITFLYVDRPATLSSPGVPETLYPLSLSLSAGWNILRFDAPTGNNTVWTISLEDGSPGSFTNQNHRWHRN